MFFLNFFLLLFEQFFVRILIKIFESLLNWPTARSEEEEEEEEVVVRRSRACLGTVAAAAPPL